MLRVKSSQSYPESAKIRRFQTENMQCHSPANIIGMDTLTITIIRVLLTCIASSGLEQLQLGRSSSANESVQKKMNIKLDL